MDVKYIRDDNVVYERVEGTTRFALLEIHRSISAAKRWTNAKDKEARGSVLRRKSLEEKLGPMKVKELLSE